MRSSLSQRSAADPGAVAKSDDLVEALPQAGPMVLIGAPLGL
jgi:hypothetical protein